jgi:hypothetical protein
LVSGQISGQLVQADTGASSRVDIVGSSLDHLLALAQRKVQTKLAQLTMQFGRSDEALLEESMRVSVREMRECESQSVSQSCLASRIKVFKGKLKVARLLSAFRVLDERREFVE